MSTARRVARRRRRASTPFVTASILVLWVCTAIAAVAFWPVYQSTHFVLMVAVTTVVASAISIVGAVYRLSWHVVALAALVAYVVLGVPLAVPDAAAFGILPTVDGLVELARGTSLAWKQLLTITLPVGTFQSLLVPAFITVLVTVTVSSSIALRARYGELAVIGPIVLLITGIAFGPTTAFAPIAVSLGLAAALLIYIVWFRLYRRAAARQSPEDTTEPDRLSSARAAAAAVVVIAIAAGGSFAASTVASPSGDRRVLRSAVVQPFDPRDYASPLSGFRAYLEDQRESSTVMTVDGLAEGDRIRIAALDSYDGVVYAVGSDAVSSESGSFTLVPYDFDQSGVTGTPVDVDITIGDYSGVWLPTVGKLESVRFDGPDAATLRQSFYYNDNSGTAAVVGGVGDGDRYRLTAIEPRQPGTDELGSLEPGDAQVPSVGLVPDELTLALNRYVASASGSGESLVAAIEGLKTEGYISHGGEGEPPSRSGHSAGRITQLLTEPRIIGDEEQYAVTAALMARELGFPSRVVVGFVPEVNGTGPTAVRGDDVSAWIEVDTAEYGWVTIDPNPEVREIPDELPEEPAQVARPQQPVQPPVEEPDTPEDQAPPESSPDDPDVVDPLLAVLIAVGTAAGWTALVAAIVLSPFVAIAAAKLRRRRARRRAATPLAQVAGGWAEFEDAVLDHGFTVPPAATRSEFAAVLAGSAPQLLASEADRAVFSPTQPRQEDADRVWRSVDELRSALDRGLSRWQRLQASVSLRSLRRAREGRTIREDGAD